MDWLEVGGAEELGHGEAKQPKAADAEKRAARIIGGMKAGTGGGMSMRHKILLQRRSTNSLAFSNAHSTSSRPLRRSPADATCRTMAMRSSSVGGRVNDDPY